MLMRFIKRLIFVILLLVIAFFVYRLINPTAANQLLSDIKSFSNDKIGTHFILTWEILVQSWVVLDTTGTVVDTTWFLQDSSGDEQLLLNDAELSQDTGSSLVEHTTWTISQTPCPAMLTVKTCPTNQEKYVSYTSHECGTYYACRTKTTTTTTPNPITKPSSSQKNSDTDIFLKNFWK